LRPRRSQPGGRRGAGGRHSPPRGQHARRRITGIAGPGGGSDEKPVGTVHVAISYAGGIKERGARFPGDRESIRWQASQLALDLVRVHFSTIIRTPRNLPPRGAEWCACLLRWRFPPRCETISRVDQRLARGGRFVVKNKARWVRPENLHVTLKFIGNVDAGKLGPIRDALAEVCSASAVELHFRGLGFFQNESVRACSGPVLGLRRILAPLAASIDARLEKLGIPRETREFSPHLTIARFDPPGISETLRTAAQENTALEFGAVRAGEFHLFESKTRLLARNTLACHPSPSRRSRLSRTCPTFLWRF